MIIQNSRRRLLLAKSSMTVSSAECPGGHTEERKGKERKWTCIAPVISITRPLSAQMWITQSYLEMHICLSEQVR